MHLHREQNATFFLSQTVHHRTAEVLDIVMRGAGLGEATEWYLYDLTGWIAAIGRLCGVCVYQYSGCYDNDDPSRGL
jgi:hypothetical protein